MAKRNHSVTFDDAVWNSAKATAEVLGMSTSQYISWLVTQSQSMIAEQAIQTAKSLASVKSSRFDEKAAKEHFEALKID